MSIIFSDQTTILSTTNLIILYVIGNFITLSLLDIDGITLIERPPPNMKTLMPHLLIALASDTAGKKLGKK